MGFRLNAQPPGNWCRPAAPVCPAAVPPSAAHSAARFLRLRSQHVVPGAFRHSSWRQLEQLSGGSSPSHSSRPAPEALQRAVLSSAAADAMVAWLRSQENGSQALALDPHMEMHDIAWDQSRTYAGSMLAAGVIMPGAQGTPTAVIALAVQLDTAHPDSPAADLDHVQVRAHWACSKGMGRGWKPPPPGWHTLPSMSFDAGGGAWQTPLEVGHGDEEGVRTMVLQVPLIGPLEQAGSGVVLVLNTTDGKWLKQACGGTEGELQVSDVFFCLDDLPDMKLGSTGAHDSNSSRNDSERGKSVSQAPKELPKPTPAAKPAPPAAPAAPTAAAKAPVRQKKKVWSFEGEEELSDDWKQRLKEMRDSITSDDEDDHVAPQPPKPPAAAAPAAAAPAPAKPAAAKPTKRPRGPRAVSAQVAQLGVTDAAPLERFITGFSFKRRSPGDITIGGNVWQNGNVCGWMVDSVVGREGNATKSLMHRFNEASELVDHAASVGDWGDRQSALAGVAVWLRLSAQRLLLWNKNYNVKPREISVAQDRLCSRLSELWTSTSRGQAPELRPLVRLAMVSVGRGGQGDVGQRVRDEILEVQHRNRCKGGMMEEWHQKLHNNTSPDDVVICEALLAYLRDGLNIQAYWDTLHAANINAERLASFDRPIRSQPRFEADQVPGLIKDLTTYLQSLRAVHCGTDLASAAGNVLGYSTRDLKGSKQITVEAVHGVASAELRTLLSAALHLQDMMSHGVDAAGQDPTHSLYGSVRLMELLVEARHIIRHAVLEGGSSCGGRHADVVFLDVALEGAVRRALESSLSNLRASAAAVVEGATGTGGQPPAEAQVGALLQRVEEGECSVLEGVAVMNGAKGKLSAGQHLSLMLQVTSLSVENAALSSYPNEEFSGALKWLNALQGMSGGELQRDCALQLLSVVERLKRTLQDQAGALGSQLQPTAEAIGHRLSLPGHAISTFSEEVVRSTASAPLSQLLGVLEPCLRQLIGSGEWQVVSRGQAGEPGGVTGVMRVHESLEEVQYNTYEEPVVLVVDRLAGHEEVPEGCVAVISARGQCPDMLAHSAVRARNMDVMLAACYNNQLSDGLKHMNGQQVRVALTGQQVNVNQA